MVSDQECSVCLKELERPCALPCIHGFCRRCFLESLGAIPSLWHGACPLRRHPVSMYTARDVGSGKALATLPCSGIYGSVFVQDGGLGVASYHFDSLGDCYISYAQAPPAWRLDDGSPLPEKKPFTDASWDADALIFRGAIEWDPPFMGVRRCDYEVVFGADLSAVVGGRVLHDGGERETRFGSPWNQRDGTLRYIRWTPSPSTLFGSVFVQGCTYAGMMEGIASYHFDSQEDSYICYSAAPPNWVLDDGAGLPTRKPFEDVSYSADTRTFRGTVRWPTGLDGATRWEFEMVFAEDFESIVGGKMTAYVGDGQARDSSYFVDPQSLPVLASGTTFLYVRRPSALTPAPLVLRDP